MIRVLVADDDDTMRGALVALVQGEPSFQLAGSARDATEAIEVLTREQPDVALIDVRMPGGGGLSVARAAKRTSAGTSIVVLSAEDDRATVLAMLEAGAVGYLVKSNPIETIIDSIRRAASGQSTLSAEVTGDVVHELAEHLHQAHRANAARDRARKRIERALDPNEGIEMVFQPIYHLRMKKLAGVEALARFSGPPRRPPDWWFAEAAKVGLGVELELAAVRSALGALSLLPVGCYLSVNVSPRTIMKAAFRRIVEAHDAGRVVVELTEHAPIPDYDRLRRGIAGIRAAGIRLAIDDAGAGFASLRHILRLDPDFVKLDRTLIAGIEMDRSQTALAAGLISFADRIEATIVAEGIERSAELDALKVLGVECGQGYHLARPGPLPPPRAQSP